MLLEIENLHVSYGAIRALHGVSLSINPGEIVTLIGSNGAGKTTLLRTISGLLRPTEGTIQFNPLAQIPSQPVAAERTSETPAAAGVIPYRQPHTNQMPGLHHLRPHEIVRLGISHVPEGRQIFPDLSIRENLMLGGYQRTDRAELQNSIDHCYTLFPILAERKNQRAGTLSGGEQQMLAIGRALMAKPMLLLLDEPSLGLAPLIVRKIFEIIQEINASGTTVFLVEQNARMALTIAHRGYVMQTGKVILSAKASELLENDEVKKAYLGG
ncbi:MAG TPA: ABC transporter ATP-binding protein [Tepidisphaeraceae bacterium]|jgi:branched-chain amino acid transport system ATP-binding protein|nr:ABC transporter ATP-binding protein [Tepidisphaeraceae bacterium]